MMKAIVYEVGNMPVYKEQSREELLKRIQYGEIVTVVGRFIARDAFVQWAKTQGTIVKCENWEGMAGVQMWIEDEGDGYDVDGNKLTEEAGDNV